MEAIYTLTTSGGVVSATAAWSGTPVMAIAVACAGQSRRATGTTGLYVSAVVPAGTCTVTIDGPAQTAFTVSYLLAVHYPVEGSASA